MTPPRAAAANASAFERLLARRVEVDWTLVAYALIFAAAFALRFWDLGARALHHDESIHAKWAWDFAQGSYTHSPVFHGPFLYLAQGFTFIVFTATDYTARISPALFGMAVVAAPLALRRWLGPGGTFAAVAFLAFSPTLVYFSRFLRMDIFLAFFLLLLVAAAWNYLRDGRARWLIVFAAALALAFSTKEAAFLFVAFLLLYLNGRLALDLAGDGPAGRSGWRRALFAVALFPAAWAIAALWPFLERLRRRAGWGELPRTGDLVVLAGTLTLPLLTPFAKKPLQAIFDTGSLDYPGVCATGSVGDGFALGFAFLVAGGIAAVAGASWRPRTWLIAAAVAVAIYATLMTSLWTNLDGLCSGAWGSIDHWQAQQDVRRGAQPWFYYLMLMPAYEFLPLALALAGGAWALAKGSSFARFLALWFVVLFAALSFAGEKMPWLNTHLAIPAALLAAWTLQRAWDRWRPAALDGRALIAIGAVLAAAALGAALLALDWGPPIGVRLAWGGVPLVAALAAVAIVCSRLGWRAAPLLAALVVVAGLAFFSLRTMVEVTFERGDVPRDLLIYTQSSPDITRMADEIDALAEATGKGRDLRIAVDNRVSFAWPWVWYLRDYRNAVYANMEDGLPAGDFDVVLINASSEAAVARDIAARGGGGFAPPTRYPHRWWFPEDYKRAMAGCPAGEGATGPCGPLSVPAWKTIGSGLFGGGWAKDAFAYWRDHEPPREPGSIDGLAWFPAAFDRASGTIPGRASPPAPDAGPVRALAGSFIAPVDIEAGPGGVLYVIDRATGVLQKFDADGALVAAIDVRESSDEPSEPWGLAVAPDGRVYVADTFGFRVLAFDGDLRGRTLAFGAFAPTGGEPPGPHNLYGPRDLAIDAAGNLWVTDTGHHRIVVYTPEGEYLREIGAPHDAETRGAGSGPGEFSEPVGIDIAPSGEVVVADMWNARVQVLDASGAYLREFPVAGWGGLEAFDKPYLRVLRDGRIALSLPSLGQVRLYSPAGVLLATIAPAAEPLLSPHGIAEAAAGKLWIVDGGAGRVRLFDGAEAGER